MWTRGHSLRMQVAIRVEKDKEKDSSLQFPEGTHPADTSTLAQWDWF